MSWEKLLEQNKLQKKSVSENEVKILFQKAQKTLRSASHLLGEDEESAYQLAYEAMLIGGRALMFSCGVKPRVVGAHKITVEFCESFLGKEYAAFIDKLDRARKKRYDLIYGIGYIVSPTDVQNLIDTANSLLSIIEQKMFSV